MKRLSSIFSSRKLPWACVVAAVLLVAIQFGLARWPGAWIYLYRNSSPKLDDGLRFAAVANAIDPEERKVLVLGASQARENVDVYQLDRAFKGEGVRFYNLGISQGQAADFFMTRQLVLDARPDFIVFVGDLNIFSSPYMMSKLRLYFQPEIVPRWIRGLGWRAVWELRKPILNAAVGYLSPAYRFRESLGRIAREEIAIRLLNRKREPFRRFAYSDDRRDEEIYEELDEKMRRGKLEDVAGPAEIAMNEAMFEETIAEFRRAGIPMVAVDAPYFGDAKTSYFRDVYAAYDAFMKRLAATYGFPYYSDAEMPRFDRTDFFDHTHLNREGRRKFTAFIREVVAKDFFAGPASAAP